MASLSGKENYIATWLVEKEWVPEDKIKQTIHQYQQKDSQSLKFLETLFSQQILIQQQFQTALHELKQAVELTCPECKKKYCGKFYPEKDIKCKECNTTLTPKAKAEDELLGETIGGCIISRKLGQGGMGSVYLAYHKRLNKWVALKILPRIVGNASEEAQRFVIEARSASQIEHRNVVGVLDVGVEKGCHYMIQQYVEGQSLQKFLNKSKRLSLNKALPILKGVARGLYFAHKQNIIHRDIKPDNIMLTIEGKAKITDFGLAKLLNSASSVSIPGSVMGTPHYMSPEQAEGAGLDHRTDIYSLGMTLFEMVTGKLPYEADSPMAVLLKHVSEPVPNPLDFYPQLDQNFAKIIQKCLAKSPEERFKDCYELLEAIAAFEKGDLQSVLTSDVLSSTRPKKASFHLIFGVVGIFLLLFVGTKMLQKNRTEKKLLKQTEQQTEQQTNPRRNPLLTTKAPTNIAELENVIELLVAFKKLNPKAVEEIKESEMYLKKLISAEQLNSIFQQSEEEIIDKRTEPQFVLEQINRLKKVHELLQENQLPVTHGHLRKWVQLRLQHQFALQVKNKNFEQAFKQYHLLKSKSFEIIIEDEKQFQNNVIQKISQLIKHKNKLKTAWQWYERYEEHWNMPKAKEEAFMPILLTYLKEEFIFLIRKARDPKKAKKIFSQLEKYQNYFKGRDFHRIKKKYHNFMARWKHTNLTETNPIVKKEPSKKEVTKKEIAAFTKQFEVNLDQLQQLLKGKKRTQNKQDFLLLTREEIQAYQKLQKKTERQLDEFFLLPLSFQQELESRNHLLLKIWQKMNYPDLTLIFTLTHIKKKAKNKRSIILEHLQIHRHYLKEASSFLHYYTEVQNPLLPNYLKEMKLEKQKPIWNSILKLKFASEENFTFLFMLPTGLLFHTSNLEPEPLYGFACLLMLQRKTKLAQQLTQPLKQLSQEEISTDYPLLKKIWNEK